MNEDSLELSLMWVAIALVLLIVAFVPQLLLVPIAGMILFLAYKVHKKRGKIEPEDVEYQMGGLVLLILAYLWPTLVWIALGFSIAKAIDLDKR